jgi:nucleotide-binding universal stress UspA family protein
MKTILIGYDGSEESKNALARAADLATALGSKVAVTSVAPMLITAGRSMGPYDPADPPEAHESQLGEARTLLEARGITPTLEEGHGDPADVILEVADKVDADLVVLGAHERSIVERALGMSVSAEVARKSHRDVLIVH